MDNRFVVMQPAEENENSESKHTMIGLTTAQLPYSSSRNIFLVKMYCHIAILLGSL